MFGRIDFFAFNQCSRRVRAVLCVLAAMLLPHGSHAASPKRFLILAPHEDDETLGCAGVIEAAVRRGDRVHVVVATNGDKKGPALTPLRIEETLKAMALLGVGAADVSFLGYGDATLARLYQARDDDELVASAVATATYAAPPLAQDYHFQRFHHHAPYARSSLRQDLEQILSEDQPSDIYVTGLYDAHPDHAALFQFTIDAVIALKKQAPRYAPVVHQYLIHAHQDDALWPNRAPEALAPGAFVPPWQQASATTWSWEERERIPVPADMLSPPAAGANRKHQAISLYPSQKPSDDGGFLYAFVKANECFFPIDLANIAPLAIITASSEQAALAQQAWHVADGKTDGAPRFAAQEWVTQGEGAGAWVQLQWREPQLVQRIVLYDRPNLSDQVLAGELLFSDGSREEVGALPNDGHALSLSFKTRAVTSVRFTITQATGHEIGLSELQVFGPSASR